MIQDNYHPMTEVLQKKQKKKKKKLKKVMSSSFAFTVNRSYFKSFHGGANWI